MIRSALCLLLLVSLGCSGASKRPDPKSNVDLTDPTLPELGVALAESLNGHTNYFNEVFDSYELARRTAPDADVNFIQDFVAGVESGEGGISGRFWGRNFRFLNVISYEKRPYLLLRSLSGQGGFNYEAFEIVRESDRYRVVDVLFFASGESFSGLMRELGVSPKTLNEQHLADLKAASAFKTETNQNPESVVANWSNLPKWLRELQSMRNFYVSSLATTQHLDVYEKEYNAYVADYPDHPSILFMRIDYDFLSGRFDDMNKTLDTLETRFSGRDPYLDLLRANALYTQHRYTDALEMIDRAIGEEPSLQEAWEVSLDYALAAKQFERAAETMRILTSRFGVQWSLASIQNEPIFADFVASEEGKAYLSELSQLY